MGRSLGRAAKEFARQRANLERPHRERPYIEQAYIEQPHTEQFEQLHREQPYLDNNQCFLSLFVLQFYFWCRVSACDTPFSVVGCG